MTASDVPDPLLAEMVAANEDLGRALRVARETIGLLRGEVEALRRLLDERDERMTP